MAPTDARGARDNYEVLASNAGCQRLGRPTQIEDLVAKLNHETRTPLTAIRVFSSILLEEPDMESAQRRQFLSIVAEEVERVTATVNRMLSS
jgi:signal transduction histidine kinase